MADKNTDAVQIKTIQVDGEAYKVAVVRDTAAAQELPRRILRQAQNRGNGNTNAMGDELIWAVQEHYLDQADLDKLYELSVKQTNEILAKAFDPKA